ncbi:MAG: ribonuclease III [Gammaproteobacteria bacterium]
MAAGQDQLQQNLDYQFKDSGLLRQALTHRSAGRPNNERLEYLGDALLDFVIGEQLFESYPEASEGELTRMRAAIVNKSALATIAAELGVGDAVYLGAGEASSGGKQRQSILADTLEAIVAAVYLDAGIGRCKEFIARITSELLANPKRRRRKDYKTQLQELLQSQGQELPSYKVLETSGKAHAQQFLVACETTLSGQAQQGSGSSKRMAEQEAAKNMLKQLDALDEND